MLIVARILVVALPLLILPGLLFHYDTTPKIALLAAATAIALIGYRSTAEGVSALWNRKSGRWLCILGLAQLVWFGVATAASSRPWFSVLGANWRRMGLLTVLSLVLFVLLAAAGFCRNHGEITEVLRAFAIAAIVASLYGIAQYFDIDPFQSAAAYHAQAGDSTITRPPGTLGHADYFGWWLAIALFCGLATDRIETGPWRSVGRAAWILSGIAVVLTGTRSAILAVLAGVVFLALQSDGMKSLNRRRISAGLVLAAVAVGFYFSPAGTRLRARVHWSADEPLGGARPLLWRDSLHMAAARPLTGFGPETFAGDFPRYQSTELARLFPDFYHESPHNSALDALTGAGIPGLLLAFGWLALGAYAASRPAVREAPLTGPLTAAWLASCVASLFNAVTIGPIFATGVVLAILVAMVPEETGRSRSQVSPAVALVVSIPAALCLTAWAVALTTSDYNLQVFQRSNGTDAVAAYNSLARTELPGAAEDLYIARRLMGTCRVIATAAARSACWGAASNAAERATRSSDNPPNAWYNLALLAAVQNDQPGVERALRSASDLAPNWFKPHWSLAKILTLTGRQDEARREARRAWLLDANRDAEVTETFVKLGGKAF
jgi:O-antigen ligase